MNVFGIMLVKNEADVLPESIAADLEWCSRILVLDNGSTDGSWELVNELSRDSDQLVPFKQTHEEYRRSLRADVFNEFKAQASHGDWWCVLDADEIYVDHPPTFLAGVPEKYNTVFSASYQFYFTDEDLTRYERDREAWLALPVTDRCRYYRNDWSERRFLRHDDMMRWVDTDNPERVQVVHRERIKLRHYKYRSPEQIQDRLEVRQATPEHLFVHERRPSRRFSEAPQDSAETWRSRLAAAADLDFDNGGPLIARPRDMPALPQTPSVFDKVKGLLRGRRIS